MEYLANLNEVISEGKKTLNLTEEQFERITRRYDTPKDFDAFRVPCNKLIRIWEDLKLPYISFYFGYDKKEHLSKINGIGQNE